MRTSWLALATLLLWQAAGPAQQPPAAPVPPPAAGLDPARNPLDAFLLRWEDAMKQVTTLSAQCSRVEENKTQLVTKTYVGTAKYLRPSSGLLEMYQRDKSENFEKIVVSGGILYQYLPQLKQIQAHHLPPPRAGQVAEDNFLSFLFGMKAAEAKRRYELTLQKEDQYYVYIGVTPRFDADKADFKQARLVLNRDSFMPRQLWFEQPNRDTVTWDFPKVEIGIRLNPADFSKPPVPQGWRMVDVKPQDQRPPVIRQGAQ
jgi:TIGR03009 family protein